MDRKRWAVPLLLAVLVLLLHVHTLNAYFISDDYDILRITEHQQGLGDALTMTYAGNWGPVSYVQFYLNHLVGGRNPLVYHLTNLFWLWLAVWALWALVRVLWPEAPFAAWAATLLFAVHPVHDEAVSYICARSHLCGATLALLALTLHARVRLGPATGARRVLAVAAALVAAYLGALAKESALTIPAWICAFEWLFYRGEPRRWLPRAGGALLRSVPYAVATAAAPLTRTLVVGGSSPKLEHAGVMAKVVRRFVADLSVYGLYGALPIPFAWIDLEALGAWRLLGVLVIAAASALGLYLFFVNAWGTSRWARAAGVYVLGLTIAAVTVAPVLYAQLPIRRRYLFIASIGVALIAAAGLERLRAARPGAARAVLALAVVAGAAGLVQRNELYRRSAGVARNFFDTVRQSPDFDRLQKISLVTMPRFYAGDNVSGAYLLHYTDILNGLRMFGMAHADVSYPLKCEFADDYSARARFVSPNEIDLQVRFRGRRAWELSRERDLADDRRGNNSYAVLVGEDPDARELSYRVMLKPGFWETDERALFLYSDGVFTRLHHP